jgi:predicted enzyme related to lactoylglutathione lyase
MTAPGIGRFAQFVDPNGAVIGLITPDRTRT